MLYFRLSAAHNENNHTVFCAGEVECPMILPSVKGQFQFYAPSNAAFVGSFSHRTVTKTDEVTILDLMITIPMVIRSYVKMYIFQPILHSPIQGHLTICCQNTLIYKPGVLEFITIFISLFLCAVH